MKMTNARVRWNDEKDGWLKARLQGQHYINWTTVAHEFQEAFHCYYPVGKLMARWHLLKEPKRREVSEYGATFGDSPCS